MSKEVKVKILDMKYDKDNNLFQIKIEEMVADHKQIVLSASGNDFGINPKIPIEIINQFCEDMTGKEKNLHIQRVDSTIQNKDVPLDSMEKAYDDTMGYPIWETRNNILNLKSEEKGDEN